MKSWLESFLPPPLLSQTPIPMRLLSSTMVTLFLSDEEVEDHDDDLEDEDDGTVGVEGGTTVRKGEGENVGTAEADDFGSLHASTSIDNRGCIVDAFVSFCAFLFPELKTKPFQL